MSIALRFSWVKRSFSQMKLSVVTFLKKKKYAENLSGIHSFIPFIHSDIRNYLLSRLDTRVNSSFALQSILANQDAQDQADVFVHGFLDRRDH